MKKRPILVEGEIAKIPLTKGYEAIIDSSDSCVVGLYNWCVLEIKRKDGTVRCRYAVKRDGGKTTMLHAFLLDLGSGLVADHINGDGLDNRRANLRAASSLDNSKNRVVGKNNTSGVKGVTFDKEKGKWKAQIQSDKKLIHLGYFVEMSEAVSVRKVAEVELHKEFSRVLTD